MYNDFNGIIEYPHKGKFYKIGFDDSKPLDEQTEEEIEIFSTIIDMSDGTSLNTDTFSIYFPFDYKKETILIKEGDLFKGDIYGMEERGRVIGVYPSQLGGCTVLLQRF